MADMRTYFFGCMFAIGFCTSLAGRRPNEMEHSPSLHLTGAIDTSYDPYALRVSEPEPIPSNVMPIPPASPRMMIIEIPPQDLYPERVRELIRKALEEMMQSGPLPFEGIEIQTDGDISPKEMEELIREALEPLTKPQGEPITA